MSNRRKSKTERTESPRYGAKRRRDGRWLNLSGLNFEFLKDGLGDQKPGKDRSLSGKDRVRARRTNNSGGKR